MAPPSTSSRRRRSGPATPLEAGLPQTPVHAHMPTRHMIGFAGGLNQYAYVGNNPTNRVDPSGLAPWGIGQGQGMLPTGQMSLDAETFSDALGLLTRAGFGLEARTLGALDDAGLIRLSDTVLPLAATDKNGIELHGPTFATACTKKSPRKKKQRFLDAAFWATTLIHELLHFRDYRSRGATLPDEPPAYTKEQDFLYALYSQETGQRADAIKNLAFDRYTSGHMMASGLDYAGLSISNSWYPTTKFTFP